MDIKDCKVLYLNTWKSTPNLKVYSLRGTKYYFHARKTNVGYMDRAWYDINGDEYSFEEVFESVTDPKVKVELLYFMDQLKEDTL